MIFCAVKIALSREHHSFCLNVIQFQLTLSKITSIEEERTFSAVVETRAHQFERLVGFIDTGSC